MKLILSAIMVLMSFSTMAAVCNENDIGLLWDNDQIMEQYECQNAKTKLCVTKAAWGYDNEQYVVISGNVKTDTGHPRAYAFARFSDDKEGSISENDSLLELTYKPVAAIIIDDYKFRYEFNLNKKTGAASYTEESKKTFSLSGWKTSVSENLSCKRIK